ncbi:hypothetical protein B9Z55_006458 [Caenorhabditis nigoni]|nr:hypothetical protein B9Z55_006458 [Caenorhabditis nigoni]
MFAFFLKMGLTCIPTQNVDVTTTTTTTANPFPCSVCSKIYNTGCQGYGIPSITNWCTPEADVPVTYTLEEAGYSVGLTFELTEQSCVTTLSCPSGTINWYIIFVGTTEESPGNNLGVLPTTAFCAESGPEAGVWYADIDGHPWPTSQMTCKNT